MMAYSGGDAVGAVVAEVGHHTTRMGYAGEDFPRSLFRSDVAVLRKGNQKAIGEEKKNGASGDATSESTDSRTGASSRRQRQGRGRIDQIRHDYLSRPINMSANDDGDWEIANPIDPTTGLLFSSPREEDGGGGGGGGVGGSTTAGGGGGSLNSNDPDASSSKDQSSSDKNDDTYNESSDLFTRFLQHGYKSALCTSPTSHPLLLIEKSYNIPPLRQHMLELLFEELDVPATFLARDAVTACYATGRTTGTVVDVGHLGTVVTPVYEGYVETKGIIRCVGAAGGGGMDTAVLENLDRLFKKKKLASHKAGASKGIDYAMPSYQVRMEGHAKRKEEFHRLCRWDMARTCKEDGAGAGVAAVGYNNGSQDHADEAVAAATTAAAYANAPKIPYKLPDGTAVDIPHTSRYDVAELLFGKDEHSVRRREEDTDDARKRLSSILSSISSMSGDNGGDSGDSTMTASGLLKRRAGGGAGAGGGSAAASASGTQKRKSRAPFSNRKLQNACHTYLQSGQIGELSSSPVPTMVCDAAFKCDRDQQAQLLGNVILAGGGACLPPDASLPDRLRDEVENIIHTHTPGWRVKVLSPNIQERAVCSWLGGSILASLGTFHDMWITRAEYEEWGCGIVNRKCP